MRKIKVLSLFDGISCGRVALERAGIEVETYYASEIEKYAIGISIKNYPNIVQSGDIKNITYNTINDISMIDLVIGGSPCQGLSSSNVWLKEGEYGINGTGKSCLFWDYVRVLQYVKKIIQTLNFYLKMLEVPQKKIEKLLTRFLE